jgi:hypothetical protein
VERFLLLWDELDELMGFGRLVALSVAHSVQQRARALRSLALTPSRIS